MAAVRTMTITQAARWLGVSRNKVWSLVCDGTLEARQNPLDKRERLISVDALQRLKGATDDNTNSHRPRLRSIAIIHDPNLQSDDIEDQLEAYWRGE